MSAQQRTEDDSRSTMIMGMEKTLNSEWFNKRNDKDRKCTLSTAQYWDWLTYIDVSKMTAL